MKILQLIDSLRPGGAEQMAVSYANALARRGVASYLCCTRMEGLLRKKLQPEVGYLYLEKQHTLDWRALKRLRAFVKEHGIQIIQAHSSSYFLAVLVKGSVPGLKVIWHDHYGRELKERKDLPLKLLSSFFDGVISVNEDLKRWALENLKVRKVFYVKNFFPDSLSSFDKLRMTNNDLRLKGEHKTKIICVANLRPQKDHFNLVSAFELVLQEYSDVSLHLVGKDEEDDYSKELKSYIFEKEFQGNIFLYGEQEDVEGLVKQANIGVLSSSSEGLPVALLEYGRAGIPVVCTAVGEIPRVVGTCGQLVRSGDPQALAEGIEFYLRNPEKGNELACEFQVRILEEYSEGAVIPHNLKIYTLLLVKNKI